MKVDIRLKKEWKNAGDTWPEGQLLTLDESSAKHLVDKGIAEIFEPEPGDEIVVSPMKVDSGVSIDKIKEIINETFKKNSDFKANQEKEDEEFKTGGFRGLGHFAIECKKSATGEHTDIMRNWLEKVSKSRDGMSEAVGPDGGFLVPIQQSNNLMANLLETSVIFPRTMKIPMATNAIDIPVIEEASRATSVFGGIIVYRPDEGGSITSSKFKLGKVELKLKKLAAMAFVTSELLEDSIISIEPLLNKSFGEAIGFQIDEDIINGTGAGQAMGILKAPSLISVTKQNGQASDTIETKNLTKMWSRLMTRSQSNAIWLANNDTFPQLAELAQVVGTGGSAAGLLQMSTNGVTGKPITTLMGRPLFITEHCQTIGDKGDIILADFGQYLLGQKSSSGIRAASSIHLKFETDQTAFRFIVRIDGQPWEKVALTPKHSTNTLSSFITLNAR